MGLRFRKCWHWLQRRGLNGFARWFPRVWVGNGLLFRQQDRGDNYALTWLHGEFQLLMPTSQFQGVGNNAADTPDAKKQMVSTGGKADFIQ